MGSQRNARPSRRFPRLMPPEDELPFWQYVTRRSRRTIADGKAGIAHGVISEASQPGGSVSVPAIGDGGHEGAVDAGRDGDAAGGKAQGVGAGDGDAS